MEELRLLTDLPRARPSLAGQPAALGGPCRGRGRAIPAEQEELLGSVIRQADALMRILTTVLEISRSEALTGRKQFAWFDVGELAAELAEMYDPLAEERGAALRLSTGPPRPVPLFGHRQLLAQAISNLIENAIRYGVGRRRDPRPRRPERARRSAIEVADRGPGIPPERRDEARAPLRPARFEPLGRRRRARPRARRSRSPTSTTASCCSRTTGPGCSPRSSCRSITPQPARLIPRDQPRRGNDGRRIRTPDCSLNRQGL